MSDHSKNGQDESITEFRRAIRHFTNRRSSISQFASYINNDPAKEQILFLHGDGGNGKTLLLRFLRMKCCKRLAADDWEYVKNLAVEDFMENFTEAADYTEVPTSLIDFGIEPRGEYRPKEAFSALLRMRRDLAGSGLRFPLYDFACILYLYKTNLLTPERVKSLFPKEDMDFLVEMIFLIEHAPGAGLTKAILGLFNKRLKEKFTLYASRRKVDEEVVGELESMDAESDLYSQFPVLFAKDLNVSMTLENSPPRVALFFDTHDAFWGAYERKLSEETYFVADEWLRCLLSNLELSKGIVAVVAGREKPRWAEATRKTITSQQVSAHKVGGLSSADAAAYLEKVEITEQEMKESLLAYAQITTDEIHPLYLGLCADIVLAAKDSGKEIVAAEFREIPDAAAKGVVAQAKT